MRAARNIGMRGKKIKTELWVCMCVCVCVCVWSCLQHVSANTRSYFFRLRMGCGGVGVAGCRAWLHLCIPQQLHSIQPQQTGSTHHQHTTDTLSAAEINTSQQSDLGHFLLLLAAGLLPASGNQLQVENSFLCSTGEEAAAPSLI